MKKIIYLLIIAGLWSCSSDEDERDQKIVRYEIGSSYGNVYSEGLGLPNRYYFNGNYTEVYSSLGYTYLKVKNDYTDKAIMLFALEYHTPRKIFFSNIEKPYAVRCNGLIGRFEDNEGKFEITKKSGKEFHFKFDNFETSRNKSVEYITGEITIHFSRDLDGIQSIYDY